MLKKGTLATAPLNVEMPGRVKSASIGVPQQLSIGKSHGHALTLEWHPLDDVTIKSISSYRKLDQTQNDVNAQTSVFAPNAPFARNGHAELDQNQVSQEIQAIGDYENFNFVAGAYYFREHVKDSASSPNTLRWNATGTDFSLLDTPVGTLPLIERASKVTSKSVAVFGQATWTPDFLNDIAHLTVGGRYTHDSKRGSLYIVNGATPTVDGVTAPLLFDRSWNRLDPMVNLSFDVTRDIMVYGKWSTGYRSGGANSRSFIYRSFDPESVSTFEIGAKTELFDRRVRFNLAAFSTKYKDQQIGFSVIIPGVNRNTAETANADGSGTIRGIEADLTLAPVTGLTISASYAYLHADLPNASNPFVEGSPAVPVLPIMSPKHSASGSIDYEFPLGNAKLLTHLDINYAARQFTSTFDPTAIAEKTVLVNGRVAVKDIKLNTSGAALEVAVWSRNLFNRADIFTQFTNSALGTLGIYNEPRTYGVTATVRY